MKQRKTAKRRKISVLPMAMSLGFGILTMLVVSLLFSAVFAMVDLEDWILNLFAFFDFNCRLRCIRLVFRNGLPPFQSADHEFDQRRRYGVALLIGKFVDFPWRV